VWSHHFVELNVAVGFCREFGRNCGSQDKASFVLLAVVTSLAFSRKLVGVERKGRCGRGNGFRGRGCRSDSAGILKLAEVGDDTVRRMSETSKVDIHPNFSVFGLRIQFDDVRNFLAEISFL